MARRGRTDRQWLRGGRTLIGMVHVGALPGTPRGGEPVGTLAARAADEARVLAECGFDGIIVENMHDAPYVHAGVDGPGHGPEIVASMTACAIAAREAVGERVMLGMQMLSGGNREAIAVAHACGLGLVRCENFVFGHVADEGVLLRAEAGPLLRYRKMIGADGVGGLPPVRVLCDLKKKHASHAITADVPLADAAQAAEFFGADGVIVTGAATGRAANAADVAEVREATELPVLVGSGVTPENVDDMFHAGADAVIVGSWIKVGGRWQGAVDRKRCQHMARAVKG